MTIPRKSSGAVVTSVLPGAVVITRIRRILSDVDVVVGEAQPGTGDPMYVELVNPSNMAPEDYGTALPTGTSVVAYLMPAFNGVAAPGTDIEIKQPEEGRPTGQPLIQPSGAQAFVVQASPV
jgi:hypothetical protein